MSVVQKQRENNGNGHAKRLGGCTGKGFMPGQSGNPGGRPQGATLLSEIRSLLDGKDGKDRRDAAKAFVAALKRGSLPHAKEIIEREEGAVPSDGQVRVTIIHVRPGDADGTPNPN